MTGHASFFSRRLGKTFPKSISAKLTTTLFFTFGSFMLATPVGSLSVSAPSGSPFSLGGKLVTVPGVSQGLFDGGIVHYTSFNWAGYFQTAPTDTFTAVKDTWKVPAITKLPSTVTAEADWVGIDGVSATTLVQDGTFAETSEGKPVYWAWTEILPAAEVKLSLVIHPGDSITALVQETADNTWLMKVTDNTTGKSGSRTVSYTTPGESVEVIHERPCHTFPCNSPSDYATLATTTNVTFDPGYLSSTAVGKTPGFDPFLVAISKATLNETVMTNSPSSAALATPSAPSSNHEGFVVADSSKAPLPPP